ncbi:MAG: glycosyltransferase family 4 protein [Armatimonadetes bacterium]|nr:glycosyltransferase family 4 protein [Armatimonadota bacterium]MDW8122404.1 glycosyltransferase family 4 protein [Armatimonadota bacterium]
MKILMVCHYTLPHIGGIEIVVDHLARGLAKRGHLVWVLSSRAGQPFYEEREAVSYFRVTSWDLTEPYGVAYPVFHPHLVPLLMRLVRQTDIVHCHGYFYQSSFIALMVAKVLKKPTVLTEHAGLIPYQSPFWLVAGTIERMIGRLAVRLSSRITAVSKTVAADLKKLVPDKEVTVIGLGVNLGWFQPLEAEQKKALRAQLGWDERPKVLYVGSTKARKRIDLLLNARDPSFDLILCGSDFSPNFASDSHILIYPGLPQPSLVRLYQAADLFVLPSQWETFSLATCEALACGLPVILTSNLKDLDVARSGLIRFADSDPEALRQVIQQTLTDKQWCQYVSQAGPKWVRRNYDWNTVVDRYLLVYQEAKIPAR